jgi:hypothetical protein
MARAARAVREARLGAPTSTAIALAGRTLRRPD